MKAVQRSRTTRGVTTGISFSISFQHPFNRAGGRTSNVSHRMKTFLTILLFVLLHAQLNAEAAPLTEPHPTSPKDATSDTQPAVPKLTEAQLSNISFDQSGRVSQLKPLGIE